MERDKVIELLKKYKQYKFAVRNYETTGWAALGSNMDRDGFGGGTFGSRPPKRYSTSFNDHIDYEKYKRIVHVIEGALETLTDDERDVIRLKWFEDVTLKNISLRKGEGYSLPTVNRFHRKALEKLEVCFRFEIEVPEIESIPA